MHATIRLGLSLLACLLSSSALRAAPAGTPPITLTAFATEAFAYSYGTWEYSVEPTDEGLRVAGGATAQGGGGGPLDIDLAGSRRLLVTLRKLPGHRADFINLILMGEDGTGSGYRLPLASVTEAWTTLRIDLRRESFRPPDMPNGPLTLARVLGYQLQGTFADQAPVALEFSRIEADSGSPEPASP